MQKLKSLSKRGLSRRRFLQTAGSLAATSVLPLRSHAASNVRVGILGGGVAGLTAAYWLKHKNVPFTLFEASNRLGGRVMTLPNWNSSKQFVELGGELLNSWDDETIWLTRRLEREQAKASGNFVPQDLRLLRFTDSETDPNLVPAFYSAGGQIYTQQEMTEGLDQLIAKMAVMKKKIFTGFKGSNFTYRDAKRFPEITAWDYKSIPELLELFASDVDRWVLEAVAGLYVIENGIPASEVNALNMLLVINTETEDGSIEYGEYDESLRLGGGNSALTQALLNSLSDYGRGTVDRYIVQGQAATAVKRMGSSFRVYFNSGTAQDFTHLIVAIPVTQLRPMQGWQDLGFSREKLQWIEKLGMGQNSKVVLDFNGRPWRDSSVVGARACRGDLFMCEKGGAIWETSRMQPGAGGVLTHYKTGSVISAGVEQNTLGVLNDFFGSAFPNSMTGQVASFDWPSHALTQGSFSCLKLGQTAEFWGAGGESECEGRLFFAGEHVSEKSQGFINGAVDSALQAARAITRSLAFEI